MSDMEDEEPAVENIDHRQDGARTRAAFDYQDECAVWGIIQMLKTKKPFAVDVELLSDLIIWPEGDIPEHVSIKKRDSSQGSDVGWTWAALKKSQVLKSLYQHWVIGGKQGTITVWSNAGLEGPAVVLKTMSRTPKSDDDLLVKRIMANTGLTSGEARELLGVLTWPAEPLPRPHEIRILTVDALRQIEDLEGKSSVDASRAVEALLDVVRAASTGMPLPQIYLTTFEVATRYNSDLRQTRRLTSSRIIEIIKSSLVPIFIPSTQVFPRPSNVFLGRQDLVNEFCQWAVKDSHLEVKPRAIVGSVGVGKTQSALEIAARLGVEWSVYLLSAADTATFKDACEATFGRQISTGDSLDGVRILETPNTLLIIDGLLDPSIILSITRSNHVARILITSIARDLGLSVEIKELEKWSANETEDFVGRNVLNHVHESDKLHAALSGNPLALTQAASYLKIHKISVTEYLKKLEKMPEVILDFDVLGLPSTSLVKALRLSLDSVRKFSPDAMSLFELFCTLGDDPLIWRSFEEFETPVILNGRDWLRKKDLRGKAPRLAELLIDQSAREKALSTLVSHSLVERIGDDKIVLHPLLRRITLKIAQDLSAALSVGLGIFALRFFQNLPGVTYRTMAQDALRSSFIIQLCLDRALTGPAFYIACLEIADWVAMTGNKSLAKQMVNQGFGWLERLAKESPQGALQNLPFRLSYIKAMAHLDPASVPELLVKIISQAKLVDQPMFMSECVWMLSTTIRGGVADINWRVVDEVLPPLENLNDLEPITACYFALAIGFRAWSHGNTEIVIQASNLVLTVGRSCPKDVRTASQFQAERLLARVGESVPGYSYAPMIGFLSQHLGDQLAESAVYIHALIEAADDCIGKSLSTDAANYLSEARSHLENIGAEDSLHAFCDSVEGRAILVESTTSSRQRVMLFSAQKMLKNAVAYFEDNPEEVLDAQAAAYFHLGQTQFLFGEKQLAIASSQKAYEIDLAQYGEGHQEVLKDINQIKMFQDAPILSASKKQSAFGPFI